MLSSEELGAGAMSFWRYIVLPSLFHGHDLYDLHPLRHKWGLVPK